MYSPLSTPQISISRQNETGAGWRYVLDKLSGWRSNAKHDQQMPRAAGVIDCDKDALAGLKEWNKVPTNVASAKCFSLPTPQHLHQPLQSGFRIRVDLEALYDYKAWKWADSRGHLENREGIADVIPEDLNQRILREEATLAGALDDNWSIFVKKKFVQAGKLPMARHFSHMNDEGFSRRMACLAKLVKDIVAYLFPDPHRVSGAKSAAPYSLTDSK